VRVASQDTFRTRGGGGRGGARDYVYDVCVGCMVPSDMVPRLLLGLLSFAGNKRLHWWWPLTITSTISFAFALHSLHMFATAVELPLTPSMAH
jgi:hypothetical protein